MNIKQLIQKAIDARKFSYSPYSRFQVGAALLSRSGKIYHGCNIENASCTPSNCAERTAFFKAVSEGENEFEAITIVGAKKDAPLDLCAPCGVCRQVMMEFCDYENFKIILAKSVDDYEIYSLKDLFPMGFGPKNLEYKTKEEYL